MVCVHFPCAISNDCPLCFPKALFEIEEKRWECEPIIEILRDGEPWALPWDNNFQFGRVKTAMILNCIDTIEAFALATNPGGMFPLPIIQESDPDLVIQLQTFSIFTNSNGDIIEGPYLRLDRIYNGKKTLHIGFGQQKAAALVLLKDNLRSWLRSVHGWYR